MDTTDLKRVSKPTLAREIATRTTDPNFFSGLSYLPNPDPILRKLGRTHEVYDGIAADAHVLGELRSVRSALLGFEWRLEAGGDSPADARALELCEKVMARRPAPGLRWPDTIWSIAESVFRGHSVHEVVWRRADRFMVPEAIVDRPQRRFVFSTDNKLRLLTRQQPVEGEALGPYKWLLTRHMASHDNPYGVALFSACFWPYTFKHSGFRFFVKFCEKYGIPWAVGKYPPGTPQSEQDAIADSLARMIEDAVAAFPDSGAVELIEARHSGEPVQERLINVCNREMSKALTSQTLATEIQGEGSRAASETHRGREVAVNESDRSLIADTMNELLSWVTELNIPGAQPPTFEFYEEAEAREEWVSVLEKARRFVAVPRWFAHERLQIPQPTQEEIAKGDLLPGFGEQPPEPMFTKAVCPQCGAGSEFAAMSPVPDQAALEHSVDAIDDQLQPIMERMLRPIMDALSQGMMPEEVSARIGEWFPLLDDDALEDLLAHAILVADLHGRLGARRADNGE